MKIKTFQGGFDKNFSYLIWCESNLSAAIIDASVNISEIIENIEINGLRLEKILITHTHADHIQFLSDILFQFPQAQPCGFEYPEFDFGDDYRKLSHNEIITIGSEMLTAIHTPGHYPDSLCFWNKNQDYLFTGDTMFVGRTGRTISDKSNISHLFESIYNKILTLPKRTIIYPGHNYGYTPSITLNKNISLSPFFQCSNKEEFIKVMQVFEDGRC